MKQFFLAVLTILYINVFSQTNIWRTSLNTGEYGLLYMHFLVQQQGDYYYATTTPNAHKRIVGGLKAAFAKPMFQKDGSIAEIDSMTIEGNTINGYLLLQKRRYSIQGTKTGSDIELKIYSKISGKIYGQLLAKEVDSIEKLKNYSKIWQSIKENTEKYIYKTTALETNAWKKFVEKMDEFAAIAEDDAEFAFGFFQNAKEIGFSHYSLMGNKNQATNFHSANYKEPKSKVRPALSFIDSSTAFLDIPAFNFRGQDIDSIMQNIVKISPKNLIIDLRNNTGGDMEGGMRICQYITNKTLYGGIMLAQNYWNKNTQAPSINDYKNFKPMNIANYEWFKNEVKNGVEGLCLITEPLATTYKGKIIILTSKATASASEPFVYTLQKENIATVIGENTSGSVLSMEYFYIENFAYTIPMLDYYAFDGKRLDQVGVQPNIICDQLDALRIALETIKEK